MKVIFLCHGNICRSVMAEYMFKELLRKNNLSEIVSVSSRATSSEENGNDIYPKAKTTLRNHEIPFSRHYARKLTLADYESADYILAMEKYNIYNLKYIVDDSKQKVHLLREWTEGNKEIDDPWYTGEFEKCYQEIEEGLIAFLKEVVLKIVPSEKYK